MSELSVSEKAVPVCDLQNLRRAGLLGLGAFAIYLVPLLLGHPLAETPETRIAVVAREMVQSGNWTVPTLGGKPRLIKPPLPYWMAATSAKLLGSDGALDPALFARAAQLPSAFLAALAVFIVALFAGAEFGRIHGLLAGAILATSYEVFHFALLGYCDIGLMCFCAGMFCCAARLWGAPRPEFPAALGFGIFLGLGILQKWFVPFMVLGLPLLVEFFFCKTQRLKRTLLTCTGFLIAGLMLVPWLWLLERRLPGGLQLMYDGIRECSSAIGHIHKDRWYMYVYVLLGGLLPWTILIAAEGWRFYKIPGFSNPRFLHSAALLGFLIFYANAKQQGYYLLPLFPCIALVGGYQCGELWRHKTLRVAAICCALLGAAGALGFGVVQAQRTRASEQSLTNLKVRLDALPPGAEIYFAGIHESKQWHYLGRGYRSLLELAAEKPGPATRVLVAQRADLAELKLGEHLALLPGQEGERVVLSAMDPEVDWQALLLSARSQRQKSNQGGPLLPPPDRE